MATLLNSEVEEIFNRIKSEAVRAFNKGDFGRAMLCIERASGWGYFYNFKYSESVFEEIMQSIAAEYRKRLPKYEKSAEERVLLVCSRILDNHELALQYIRALIKCGSKAKIISIKDQGGRSATNTLKEIQDQIDFEWIEDLPGYVNTTMLLAKSIIEFQPTKIFAHIVPWDVRSVVAISAAKQCPCFNINFNDHTFWIGTSMLDYLIEFRSYGATISVERRGLKKSQLIHLPYYPILNDRVDFQGFPFDRTGKIVIFSGGDTYKMMDETGTYFSNIDRILEANKNVVFFIATAHTEILKEIFSKYKNHDRVFVSGMRRDIYQVFKNCDIYYGTGGVN